jgi:transcription elongation factor
MTVHVEIWNVTLPNSFEEDKEKELQQMHLLHKIQPIRIGKRIKVRRVGCIL